MTTVAFEQLGRIPAEAEAELLQDIDSAFAEDDGAAVNKHLAAGRSIYFREPQTPAGHVLRKHPDGSLQLVRFDADGTEHVVSEPAAA